MNTTTVAVDLAKSVFQLAVADASRHVIEQHHLTRSQFGRWFISRNVSLVIMEPCGSAHHWARQLNALGIDISCTPAACIDWRFGDADSMAAQTTPESTTDAGYTTAGFSLA